jgi:HPt (histidine-containing phosphotransfer) domain-containing protein
MDTDSHDTANDPLIDQKAIQDLRDEGGDLLGELVDMFIAVVPLQLASLEEALVKRDTGAIRLTAHTLKGTASNFGARRMQTLAQAIEDHGRDGALDGASAILSELRAECERVREALEAVR